MDHSWLWEVKYLIYQIQWFIITAKLIYRHGLRIHEYMTGTSWMNKTRVNTPVELHAIQLQTTTASMLLKSLGLLLRQIFNNRSSLFQNTWNHASWNILEIHTRSDHSWTAGDTMHRQLNKKTWIQLLNWQAPAYRQHFYRILSDVRIHALSLVCSLRKKKS